MPFLSALLKAHKNDSKGLLFLRDKPTWIKRTGQEAMEAKFRTLENR